MVSHDQIQAIIQVAKDHSAVKLVYLFGSQASGDVGPLSDYDIAAYVDETETDSPTDLRLELLTHVSRILKSDQVDLVLLNRIDAPALKYNIITTGQLLFEREPYRLLIEPRILNDYFDFQSLLQRYNLTRSA